MPPQIKAVGRRRIKMKLSNIDINDLLARSYEEKWNIVCGNVKDDGETADVAILLGSRPARAIERASAAAELYRAGRVKHVVASGGVKWEHDGEELSEAELMKRVMIAKGVPEEAIILDNEARTTVENMICSTLVINRTVKISKTDSVIIVTSQSHMRRSLALAKALLPRKFKISGYPSYPDKTKEEWLSDENNCKILDSCITLLKSLVDNRVVEDVDIDV